MIRALLIAALLVTGVAPAWAQSDSRWVAIFTQAGDRGKGQFRSQGGNGNPWAMANLHIVRTILDRTGTPYKEFSLPDSAAWASVLGPRLNGEADSVRFRRNGCMGWVMVHDLYSSSFDGAHYSGEATAYFTGTGVTKGTFACSPLSGTWGIPGVTFTAFQGTVSNAGQGFFNGIATANGQTGTGRVRQTFANGDTLSMFSDRAMRLSPAEAANVTVLIRTGDSLSSSGTLVAAWKYKNATWYTTAANYYTSPTQLLLAIAGLFDEAGYKVRRKLNLHIDLDHPFPDDVATETAPSDSFFAYVDRQPWRFGGPIESHSSEIADDAANVKSGWLARANKWPGHPHSHNYLNFGSVETGTGWNATTFADSATKRARWNFMESQISDTLQSKPQRGYERTATFPNNDVMFPDLYIMASAGFKDIRVRSVGSADSLGAPRDVNLRFWQRVLAARIAGNASRFGMPYLYIEPKTNLPLWVHDSSEQPLSSNDTYVTANTNYTSDWDGFNERWLSDLSRMTISDGGHYWHPDENVTKGNFMAGFHRRLTYFYGRVKNLVEITPVYLPRTPRSGGTSRTTYSDNR